MWYLENENETEKFVTKIKKEGNHDAEYAKIIHQGKGSFHIECEG
jgi:hypothetical protein